MKRILLTVLALLCTVSLSYSQTFTGTGGAIPDNSCTAAHEFPIAVTGVGMLTPSRLAQFEIDITHTFNGDLDISLISPAGTVADISSDNGGAGDNYTGTIFDDNAAVSIVGSVAPHTGSFIPEDGLNTFCGENADGTWIVRVCDDAGGDTGTLNSLSLTFEAVACTGPPPPPANDVCAGAEAISCGATATGDTTNATNTDAADCSGNGVGNGLWYSFAGNGDIIDITSTPTGWDSEIQLWSGACGTLTCEDRSDSAGSGGTESITSFATTAGVDYYIYVGYWSSFTPDGGFGAFDVSITCVSCAVISITDEGSSNCGATYDRTIEVSYSGEPTTGTLDITSSVGTQSEAITGSPQTVVITGLPLDGLDEDITAAFSDLASCTLTETALFTNLTGCPPANDLCAGAEAVACGATATGDTTNATNSDAADCSGNGIGNGLWYVFAGTGDVIDVSSTPTGWDNEIQVWSGTCGTLNCEGRADSAGSGGTETVTGISTVVGTDYYIYVGYWSSFTPDGGAGAFDLTITCTPPTPPTPVDCAVGSVNTTYCYDNNDNTSFTYESTDGVTPLTVTFNAGYTESCCDELIITDSDGTTQLFNASNGGDLTGLSFTSSGSSITVGVSSDGSISCMSGAQTPWDWDVSCNFPVSPGSAACTPGDVKDISAASMNDSIWVPFLDASGALICEINANGEQLGSTSVSIYVDAAATRLYNGDHYSPRNVEITPTNQPTAPVSVRIYMTGAELAGWIAADPLITSEADIGIFREENTCDTALDPTMASFVTQTLSSASYGSVPDAFVEFDTPNFSTFFFAGSATLPVELTEFIGLPNGKFNDLFWTTASESGTSHFTVERSVDGRAWDDLGEVEAVGDSNITQQYQFADSNPYGTSFYRLRMVDNDDSFEYSDVVRVVNAEVVTHVSVFPNPTSELFIIEHHDILTVKDMQLIGVKGDVVRDIKVDRSNTNSVDVSNLPSGIYFLKIVTDNGVETVKVIKQ